MHIFEFKKSPDEMDDEELRSTLTDFMEKHAENVEDYEALESARDEFSEKVEALEGDLETAQTYFADKASEYTHLDTEVIVERFSLVETIEMAGEAEEAQFSEADDGDVDDEDETKFSDKPERAPAEGGQSKFRDQAESDLESILGY